MKYALVIIDGAADRPIRELNDKTPLQVARKPNLDRLASIGTVGLVRTVPEGMYPGSDIANMSILGYDPARYYTGRAPLEAASMEIPMNFEDVAFRCNLIATDGERLLDYSGGHISTEEARILIGTIQEKLGTGRLQFYPGVSYRHLMLWREGKDNLRAFPPHDIQGQPLEPNLPEGDGEKMLRRLMWDSLEILDNHEINKRRRDEGKLPANMIWLWGQGRAPRLPGFLSRYGLTGSMISAVDLLKGIARLIGLQVIEVPGATGYRDTNYLGKARYALESLQNRDFVCIHIEAADESGHEGNIDGKIASLEDIDSKVIGPLMEGLVEFNEYRILALPDHPTPIEVRTHVPDPVPFVLAGTGIPEKGSRHGYDEICAEEWPLFIEEGHRLIERLFASPL